VLVVVRRNALADEVDHLDIQLQRNTVGQLAGITVAASTGKRR
jgi:hypothetical protein